MARNLKFSTSTPLVDVTARQSWKIDRLSLVGSLEWSIIGSLVILVVLGFGLRVNQLGASGFAEDEMNKLDAVRAYQRGDFTANGEHPMLMKVLMWGSLNAVPASDEVALRLPNALIGALTVIPLFLLTAAFFDRWTAMLAAAFWAFGINAITHNRIGKEDSLLVFFMLFAFFFFARAKQLSPADKQGRARRYAASAVSFGLMIASKYFPHYFGLNMLFHHNFRVRKAVPGEPGGRVPGWFYLTIIGVFLVANPAVLLPEIWNYLNAYMSERLLTHSGYLFAGELYKNNMSSSPFWGTPIYFYLLFLAVKVPLIIGAAFVVGLIIAVRRPRHVGHAFLLFMFLFWIVPYSLIGGKWLRYTLSLMPWVYMLAAVGVMGLIRFARRRFDAYKRAPVVVSALAVALFVVLPAWTAYANGPHFALYTNALAPGKAGYFFPHDEFYDEGLREAIRFVCEAAPNGATMAHETPAVARYYLSSFGRQDLKSETISSREFDVRFAAGPVYVIVQRGRTYFENRDELDYVRTNFQRIHEVRIDGATAAEVFVNHQPQ
ncbi:MAG TPA: glycosyltransferase family 39 protein [Pyrinomonadaceae bacterium]|nr:glycosyltransferase family 39 protein [Pyrinomonadaceae bacterium]